MSRSTGKSSKSQTTMPGVKDVSRRDVLSAALGAVPGMALATLHSGSAVASQALDPNQEPRRLLGVSDCDTCLRQPDEIKALNGVLDTSLDIRFKHDVPVGSKRHDIRMFGYPDPSDPSKTKFTVPGPTLRIRRADETGPLMLHGDRIEILLKNDIDVPGNPLSAVTCNSDPDHPHDDRPPNCFHGDNVTNYHFHGFHISPEEPSDDVFLKLPPGHKHQISVAPLPANQAEGTHWYHPHKHGSTALQVLNGMAGAFIVEGPFDDALNALLPDMKEVIFVVQDIGDTLYFPQGGTTQHIELLVNGQLNPKVRIRGGEIQRWRFIGATMHTAADSNISFDRLEVKQIAQDGVQYSPENYELQPKLPSLLAVTDQPSIDLAPGNRVDVLVKAPLGLTGTVSVFATSNAGESLPDELRSALVAAQATTPLFDVDITENGPEMEFPTPDQFPKLPDFLKDIEQIDNTREVAFQMIGATGRTRKFCIDGKRFDPDCVNQRMQLGKAEEWTVSNNSTIAHPCHIHVNPFQLVEYNGNILPKPWIWMDTIALPKGGTPDAPTSVKIRHRFLDFEGRYVMHCHILGHEDRGMMQVIEVGDKSGYPLCEPAPDPQTCPA